jgi:hypothetical protein
MKWWTTILVVTIGGLAGARGTAAETPIPLNVLYIGSAKSPRAGEFAAFLKKHFARVTVADRAKFEPMAARDADVVLFDWSQSEGDLRQTPLPLGRCEDWTKPTVLLNHAGLLVAGRWELIGGAG